MRAKVEWLKDRAMEQDEGFGIGIWGVAEIEDVSVGLEASDYFRPRRGVNGLALGADGDFAVITDADAGLLTPDIGPPRAGWGGPQDGAVFRQGQAASRQRGGPEFPMDFMLVGMKPELVQEAVGPFQFEDLIGGQEWRQAFLPVVVAAFDFTFGLGGGGVAQGDAIEAQRGAELGESLRGMGKEEGVVVHIQDQGHPLGEENT